MNPLIAACILLMWEERVLLVQKPDWVSRSNWKWYIPGGRVQYIPMIGYEPPAYAASRSVFEATGLKVTLHETFDLVGVYDSEFNENCCNRGPKKLHVFCRDVKHADEIEFENKHTYPPPLKMNEEFSGFSWMHYEDVLKAATMRPTAEVVTKMYNDLIKKEGDK